MSCRGECLHIEPGVWTGRHAPNCVDNPGRRERGSIRIRRRPGGDGFYIELTHSAQFQHGSILIDQADIDDLRHLLIEDLAAECDRLRAELADLKRCEKSYAGRRCEHDHGHRGLHIVRYWDARVGSSVVDEWGDLPP